MDIQNLKSKLLEDLKPVRTLADPKIQLFRFLIFCSSIIFLFSFILGIREDFEYAINNNYYYQELIVLILLSFLIAYNALVLAIPGRKIINGLFVSLIVFCSWILIIFSKQEIKPDLHILEPDYYCAIFILISTILFNFVLSAMISKGYPTRYVLTYLYALLSSSSLGAVALHLLCPRTTFDHIFYWHFLPVIIVPIFGLPILLCFIKKPN